MRELIGYLFKSLYNNSIVIEQRKKRNIGIAIVFMLLSLILVVIPTLVTGFNTNGSKIITNSNNYEVDRIMTIFADEKYDVTINDDSSITVNDSRLLNTFTSKEADANPIVFTQKYKVKDDEGNDVEKDLVLFKLFYYDGDPLATNEAEKDYTAWLNTKVLYKNDEGTPLVAPRTYLVITKSYFSLNVYNPLNSDTNMNVSTVATFSGLYDRMNPTFTNFNQLQGENSTETFNNICTFFDKAYESSKVRAVWLSTGLNIALSFIFIAIGVLCLFIFLRGKNSIYTNVSFVDAIKIGFTYAFSPAIIALALGFFMSSSFGASFMIPYAFRVIWAVSKSRNNMTAETNKPVYQARS